MNEELETEERPGPAGEAVGPHSDKVRLRRLHKRGAYDKQSVYAVLDAMPLCSVGYVIDGAPYVTATLQWREGDHVYWHGSSASRMLRSATGAQVCLSVSILDGFVLARSGMHHSTNYRSATLFGVAEKVEDAAHKAQSLKRMVEGLFPGRWDTLRPATAQELKATTLLRMPIEEFSVKAREGGPNDDAEDYELPIWAGVLPVRMSVGALEPDPRNLPGVAAPTPLLRPGALG